MRLQECVSQIGRSSVFRILAGTMSQRNRGTCSLTQPHRKLTLERQQIVSALEKTNGKIYGSDGAAELLGMRPTALSSKIAALKIKRVSR